jgi:hypothetical protein
MAEAQADYVAAALAHMRERGLATLTVKAAAEDAWNDEIARKMHGTVWLEGGCQSWYLDRNGRNTSLWPDFSFRFARALRTFDPAEHEATGVDRDAPVLPLSGDRSTQTA